jgi:hypothetical protein
MTRRKRRKGLTRQDKRGLLILSVALATVVFILVLSFFVRDDSKYDAHTLCPTERAFGRTVVVVDKTDPFSPTQSAFLRLEVKRLRGEMEQSEKLTIYVLDKDSFAAPSPVFELCNPGSGAQANALYQNPEKIRLRFEERFGKPLDSILENLVKGDVAKFSPIMEMIRNVSFRDDFDVQGEKRQLVLISDMLQHTTGGYSHYPPRGKNSASEQSGASSSRLSFSEFKTKDEYRRVKASLSGVNVRIIYFRNRNRSDLQTPRHVLFWEDFFADAGATLVEVRYGP